MMEPFHINMIWMEWMMTDMKRPLSENIKMALEHHERKYGKVPNIVEHGDIMPPPMYGIRFHRIRIPSNILLLGIE